jgi:hypothetical protein
MPLLSFPDIQICKWADAHLIFRKCISKQAHVFRILATPTNSDSHNGYYGDFGRCTGCPSMEFQLATREWLNVGKGRAFILMRPVYRRRAI